MVADIRGKAFRTTEELLDAGVFQGGHPPHGVHKHRFEVRKVPGDLVEAEILRYAVHSPGTRMGLERADQELAGVILVVGAGVVIPQNRQGGGQALHPFEQDIIVLAGMQRGGDADGARQVPGPHPAADHHIVSLDRAFGGLNAGHPLAIVADPGDLGVLVDPRPASPRALGQGLGDVDGIGIAVAWNVDAAHHVGHIGNREKGLDLVGGHHIDLEIEDLGHGSASLQLLEPLLMGGHGQRAALAIAGGLPGLGFEAAIELPRVLGEPGHVDAGPQLSHQARRVPGGSACEHLAFQEDDVAPADFGGKHDADFSVLHDGIVNGIGRDD